jgi:plasmid stability protein
MCQMCDEYEAELARMGIAMNEKITVELDSETMDAVRRDAKAHGHDVANEVREIVRQKFSRGAQEIDYVQEFRRIRAMTPKGVKQTPAWKIIRESRDNDH